MPSWMVWLLVLWFPLLIFFFATGGYFMFRKFLKGLPKEDGKSDLEWQEYYIEQTKHMWTEPTKELLRKLVQPVPKPFRDVASQSIAAKIGELALKENAKEIDQDLVIRGYIIATPKRDHKWLIKALKDQKIDLQPYKELLQ